VFVFIKSSNINIHLAGKPGKKGKKKGSDSDSDEDWGKNKKAPGSTAKKGGGGGGGGAKGKGGGYTRAITLSPELAAVVGAEQMARHEVVKKVWSIVKERNLYVSIIRNHLHIV
jgi:upstream activation factor subunit UAF30